MDSFLVAVRRRIRGNKANFLRRYNNIIDDYDHNNISLGGGHCDIVKFMFTSRYGADFWGPKHSRTPRWHI